MPPTLARPELLASPDWLAENLTRPGVRVIDCRWRVDGTSRQLFNSGHIPGAVFLDWPAALTDARSRVPFQLAGPEAFASAMGLAGVGNGMTAILYDDTASLYACRVWWSLSVYGYRGVRVLDGGWPAWERSGRPSSVTHFGPTPAVFTPRADPHGRLSTSDVRALLGSRDVVVVDARGPAEYRGLEGNADRLGHIPGAVNLPAGLLTRPGVQTFLEPAELVSLVKSAGVDRARRVVVYDSIGVGSAKVCFCLSLLGYEDVAVYDGGWAEWGNRQDLPIER